MSMKKEWLRVSLWLFGSGLLGGFAGAMGAETGYLLWLLTPQPDDEVGPMAVPLVAALILVLGVIAAALGALAGSILGMLLGYFGLLLNWLGTTPDVDSF